MSAVWIDKIEDKLVDLVSTQDSLWKVKERTDFEQPQMISILYIRNKLNMEFNTNFTDQMVIKKWLEIRLLFDIKFAMNSFSLDDRGHHIRRDGSMKDDLNESWKHFKKLGFLISTMDRVEPLDI